MFFTKIISNFINFVFKLFNIIIVYRYGNPIGEIVYLTSFIHKLHKENPARKIIVITKYHEIFFNNKKIFLNIKFSGNPNFNRFILFILNRINGLNIINFNPPLINLEKDIHFLINYSKKTHIANLLIKNNQDGDFKNVKNEFFFSEIEKKELEIKLKLPENFALIHSETKKDFSTIKNWGHKNIQEVVNGIKKIEWIQIGLSTEYNLNNVQHKFDLSIREMAYVVYRCRFLVSLEGVFNHLASCFLKKNFLILSGMLPLEATFYPNNIIISATENLSCFPCYKLNNCFVKNKPCTNKILPVHVIDKINNSFPNLR